MHTVLSHIADVLNSNEFLSPGAVLKDFDALHFPDWCICAYAYLYLRIPENGALVSKHIGVIWNVCAVCNPTVCFCRWMWIILDIMHWMNNIKMY